MLTVDYCWLFVVCLVRWCPLCAVCCWFYIGWRLTVAVRCLLCAVLVCIDCRWLLVVCCSMVAVCCLVFGVNCLLCVDC